MALGSQVGNLEAVSDITGLVHEIYAGKVKPNLAFFSPTASLFQRAGPGQYRLDGEKLVGAADLLFAGGALGTSGYLPDHEYVDPANWETTPVRLYVRRAIDNFVQARGITGPGAFGDLGARMFEQMWEAFGRMRIRHAVGTSTGTICLVDTRTDGTHFSVKDGYGFTGAPPLMHLEPGMCIAWVDSDDGIDGAARITAINYSTRVITVDSESTWEPVDDVATGDKIVFATTNNISTDYFVSEFNNAPNGSLDLFDPAAGATTVLGIAEGTYPRWKPFRKASSTFDHIEVTEFFQQLAAKSTSPVSASTHTCVAQGAVLAELARTLVGFQQQQNLGRTFEGGYTAVRIGDMDFLRDDFQIHNVLYALSLEDLWDADLDGEADYFAEDGSQFSRLADFDGKEWYVKHYKQTFVDRRNRFGMLTGITLSNVSATDYDPSPNY